MFTLINSATTLLNPYQIIATQHQEGLDDIVDTIGATPEVSDIVSAVYDYVQGEYYPSPDAQTENELTAIIYDAINGYGNQLIRATSAGSIFNINQQTFIEMMLNGVLRVPVNAVDQYLSDIEDNITKSGLTIKEQLPLLIATLTGRSDYAYWIGKVETPGDWSTFFSPRAAVNFANIPYWVAASMEGALLAARRNNIDDPAQYISGNSAHALATGLATTSVRVVLKMTSRIQPDVVNKILGLLKQTS